MLRMNPYAPPMAPLAPPPGPLMPGQSQPRPISPIAAVRFAFDGPDWKNNMLLGAVLMLIPLAGPITFAGWMCETHQRLVRRHPQPFPKFDFADFAHYLTRGVMPFLVNLVVTLPMILAGYVIGFALAFGAFGAAAATEEPLVMVAVLGIGGLVTAVLVLCLTVVLNAAMTRAELTEDFGRSLSSGPLFAYIRSTFWRCLIKQLVFGFISYIVVLIGLLLCVVGLYPAVFVIQVASMHLRWQLYDDHVGRGGEPIELKPPQWLPSELARMQGPPPGRG
jgi:Protein of unknown function (DUF4013)